MKDWLALAARIMVSTYLVASSIALMVGYNGVKFYLLINKFTHPEPYAIGLCILVSIFSLFLLIGYKIKIASIFFLVYLLALNIFSPTDFNNPLAVLSFTKNISMVGGILYMMSSEPGKYSFETYMKRLLQERTKKRETN